MKNFKKAMKNFKKVRLSLGMKIIALLSCVALLSMGFASWWILNPTTGTTTGSFTTYEVEMKNITIDTFDFADKIADDNDADDDAKIIFGRVNNITQKWLLAKDVALENLDAEFTFKVKVNEGGDDEAKLNELLSKVTMEISVPDNAKSVLNSAITAHVITAPTATITYQYTPENSSAQTYTVTGNYSSDTGKVTADILMENANVSELTITVVFDFNWGTAFGGENPYKFYNEAVIGDGTDADFATMEAAIQDANTKLSTLADLDTVNYTALFTPVIIAN